MRHLLLIPPLAAFATGCTERTSLPEAAAPSFDWSGSDYVDEAVSRDEVFRRWQEAVDPTWAPYAKYTLIAALGNVPMPEPPAMRRHDIERAGSAAWQVAQARLPPDTMWVVDLSGEESVAFGAWLSRSATDAVSLVPTFHNWPARNEVVPAERTMAAMARMLPRAVDRGGGTSVPVFLLDAWRLVDTGERPLDELTDNRYALGPSDFPQAEELRARGIRRVVYVVEDRQATPAESDDLHELFTEYQAAGIELTRVDLGDLTDIVELEEEPPAEPAPPWDWNVWFSSRPWSVPGRVTVLQQPHFYVRSHGGFGGVRAAPHVIASGVGVGHGGGSHGGFGGGHGGHGGGG
jgi:hypothetical protein